MVAVPCHAGLIFCLAGLKLSSSIHNGIPASVQSFQFDRGVVLNEVLIDFEVATAGSPIIERGTQESNDNRDVANSN